MTSSSLKARSRAILIDCYAFAVFASIIISVLNIVLFCLGDLASFSSRRNIVGSSLNLLISLILFAVSTLLQTGYCFLSLNIARTGDRHTVPVCLPPCLSDFCISSSGDKDFHVWFFAFIRPSVCGDRHPLPAAVCIALWRVLSVI